MLELVLTVRRPTGAALVYRFDDDEITVGRGRGCGVQLPDKAVSSVHLRFIRGPMGYVVLDAGSTHGSRLGGQPLAPGQPMPVRDADTVALGPYLIEVFLDAGGGLTTDSRDTDRLASALTKAARAGADRWRLWVVRGRAADTVAALGAHAPLWVGTAGDCDLVLPDAGVAPRHLLLRWGDGGPEIAVHGAPVRVSGRRVREAARVQAGDTIVVGDAVLRLDGPGFDSAGKGDSAGWSVLEMAALVLALAGLGAVAWMMLGR